MSDRDKGEPPPSLRKPPDKRRGVLDRPLVVRDLSNPERTRVVSSFSQIPQRKPVSPRKTPAPGAALQPAVSEHTVRKEPSPQPQRAKKTARRHTPPETEASLYEKRQRVGSQLSSSDEPLSTSEEEDDHYQQATPKKVLRTPPKSPSPPQPPPRSITPDQRSHDSAQYEQGGEESYSWGSTTYATLAASAGRSSPVAITNPSGLPQDDGQRPSTSYAQMVAAPAVPRPPPAAVPTDKPADQEKARYPPIVAESLPDWTRHFKELNRMLGHPLNARPFGKGVRFTPQSANEFRVVQRYMVDLTKQVPSLSWYCYTPEEDKPTKVGIRGLPMGTDPKLIEEAIRAKGFPIQHVKAIPPRRSRPGCIYFAQLEHLSLEQLQELYKTDELLYMRGVVIEAWQRKAGPAQCHRCQAFGHASANCFRPVRCVRCAGEHIASECPRGREEQPTCANCGKNHTANDRRCPVLRRTARRQGITLPGLLPEDPKRIPQSRPKAVTIQQDGWATITGKGRQPAPPPPVTPKETVEPTETRATTGATLQPPANPATERQPSKKRRRERSRKKAQPPQAVTSTPTPTAPVASQAQITKTAKGMGRVPERALSEHRARSTGRARSTHKLRQQVQENQHPSQLPTPSYKETTTTGLETADAIQRLVGIAIEVGTQVLADIRAGTDPVTAIMKALANLLARHYGGA